MEEEFYTIEDIKKILKIGRNLCYELVNSNGFPSIKIGRTIRVPKKAFEKWINDYTGKTYII